MGLPVLGAVPYVRRPLNRSSEAAAQLEECVRELRLSVTHAHGGPAPVLLCVTSPESGDGKSTIAASLAVAFADHGSRTILIDGDIRRGVLHHVLGTSRVPGLTDYLAGHSRLSDVIVQSARGQIAFIPSGTRMQGGPELLGTAGMTELLEQLKADYDAIIVDTAPLGAGVDAYLVGTATGNIVLVLRTGTTDGELASAKLDLLDRLPVRVLGAVLNAVPRSRAYRYYSYLPGYRSTAEESPVLVTAGSAEAEAVRSA
jgi:capsular exopolysaccharide synthesis family protein